MTLAPETPNEPTVEPTVQVFKFFGRTYDIEKALALIARNPDRPRRVLDVKDAARALGLDKATSEYRAAGQARLLVGAVDEEYARNADLSVPGIMADLSSDMAQGPIMMLIDGTHRLRRAYVDGLETLPVYVLDRAEVRRIRVR